MAVTRGSYKVLTPVSVADMDWNHMDPHHREHVHRTYGNSLRICTGADFQLSLTKYGRWPLLLPVIDVRVAPGLFYQCVSVFSLVTLLSVIRSVDTREGTAHSIDWYIVSKSVWKFLHPWLNRRMERLNRTQNAEDDPVRLRRLELRRKGFSFKSDQPDFLVSSSLLRNTMPPKLERESIVALGAPSAADALRKFTVERLDFLYLRESGDAVKIWPAVCPHEGGPLEQAVARTSDGRLKCPWHGLEFPCVELTRENPEGQCQGARIRFEKDSLAISPTG